MAMVEINFDGIVGPSHNYAGLAPGNIAATQNAGAISRPKAAALQGLTKMRAAIDLGQVQGILLPHPRPNHRWLTSLSTDYDAASAHLRAQALSASAMWAANAATVSPAADTVDGRCHLTVANLMTMPHRSHEWPATLAQLRLAFADPAFVVHPPVPAPFGDEGAANHMRLGAPGAAGVEIFVYGASGGVFPVRQHREASAAVARAHGVKTALFVQQSIEAIAAGAFHNDVVAVSDGDVIFAHEHAFADRVRFYADLKSAYPAVAIVEVPASAVSLDDAIRSYLFNAQLLSTDRGTTLLLPDEARENPRVWRWLGTMVAGNGPIRRLRTIDVRESMANGGGPACLRLRVAADPATIDRRFLVDEAKIGRIMRIVEAHWPDAIDPSAIGDAALIARIERARAALLEALDLVGLIDS
ncbi:N-succinylarginine dihydrolase [Sphingomonas bacterium]|uniref:N-succinylarginine dihydrolase n=1 Tax=Sphingomonas bacterium TaxID=1895847 RepID=UPI00157690A5|nr:N-succinylarginine dihydrolase [Sphingomonas bacterium]